MLNRPSALTGLRLAVVALILLVVGSSLIFPIPSIAPRVRDLVRYRQGQGPDPVYASAGAASINVSALQRAATVVPSDAKYFLHTSPKTSPLVKSYLQATGHLYLLPRLSVRSAAQADWVLSYQADPLVPRGVARGGAVTVGPRIYVVRVVRP